MGTHPPTRRPSEPGRGLLERLREDTRDEHRAIEATLGLVSDGLTLERYRLRLEQLHGFYLPIEEQFASVLEGATIDLVARRKTPLLRVDLQVLGGGPVDELPTCASLPPLRDRAEGWGCLYVLEGATLGGRLVARHVRARLGVTPERGGRFFEGYGASTGAMWSAFRAALVDFSASCDRQGAVVEAAVATFRALRWWCERPELEGRHLRAIHG